jgi:hypothetical protein
VIRTLVASEQRIDHVKAWELVIGPARVLAGYQVPAENSKRPARVVVDEVLAEGY